MFSCTSQPSCCKVKSRTDADLPTIQPQLQRMMQLTIKLPMDLTSSSSSPAMKTLHLTLLGTHLLLLLLLCTPTQSLHTHENHVPKGWGEVQRLRVVAAPATSASSDSAATVGDQNGASLSLVNAAVVDQRTAAATDDGSSTEGANTVSTVFDKDEGNLAEDGIVFALPAKARPSSTGSTASASPQPLTSSTSTSTKSSSQSSTKTTNSAPVVQFLWRVYNYSTLAAAGQDIFFSPRFYLNSDLEAPSPPSSPEEPTFTQSNHAHQLGYRLQLLLIANTTYLDSISYLGVFFRIVAGDHDAGLEWPYKYRTVLSILEHEQLAAATAKTAESNNTSSSSSFYPTNFETLLEAPILSSEWNHTVVPNIDECRLRSAFLRPNSDSDTAANLDGCGSRRHMPLALLLNSHNSSNSSNSSEGNPPPKRSFTTPTDDTLLVLITIHLTEPNQAAASLHFSQAVMAMRYNHLVSNFEWTIKGFSHREKEATERGRIAILTSSPFYTHQNGYLLQLFLTVLPKRSAFAVSIAFVQGDHDRYLQWPFPYTFEMAIVDQSPDYWKRDLTVQVQPSKSDCGTEAFGQPGQQPEFCFLTIQSLQVLSLTHYNFLANDTLKIRFTTRFARYSARQRASIGLANNGRLVSEFNWLIPGLVGRFERYIQESYEVPPRSGASSPTSSASSATRASHKFVSDEFYTNGQGYLCQLQLTVTVRSVPLSSSSPSSSSPSPLETNSASSQTTISPASEPSSTEPTSLFKPSGNPYTDMGASTSLNTSSGMFANRSARSSSSQDILVFGLELVIIEGDYDRFLEWPFSSAYELSIVGYKNLPGAATGAEPPASSTDPPPVNGGQLYTADTPPPPPPKGSSSSGSESASKRTSSTLVIPAQQVASGQCPKESFQKPIERNPACGINEFVRLTSTEESRERERMAKQTKSQNAADESQQESTFSSANSQFKVGKLGGKSEEDLHLRVRIYL